MARTFHDNTRRSSNVAHDDGDQVEQLFDLVAHAAPPPPQEIMDQLREAQEKLLSESMVSSFKSPLPKLILTVSMINTGTSTQSS